MKNFRLDLAHYVSLPSFSWDAALLFCNEMLELIEDESIYSMLESNCRGGICQVSKRYGQANNPYVEGYDPTRETNYLIQVDANNLYGLSLASPLPYKNFGWVTNKKLKSIVS